MKEFTYKTANYSKTFRFKNGINYEDYIEKDGEYLLWRFPPFGGSCLCWALNREELDAQIAEELDFLYGSYAMAKDSILHPSAIVLKQNFWKLIEVIE